MDSKNGHIQVVISEVCLFPLMCLALSVFGFPASVAVYFYSDMTGVFLVIFRFPASAVLLFSFTAKTLLLGLDFHFWNILRLQSLLRICTYCTLDGKKELGYPPCHVMNWNWFLYNPELSDAPLPIKPRNASP